MELLALGATVPATQGMGCTAPSEHELPAGQAAQPACETSPVALLKLPDSHGVGVTEPRKQNPPGVQLAHAVAPLSDWYMPGEQLSQLLCPPTLM